MMPLKVALLIFPLLIIKSCDKSQIKNAEDYFSIREAFYTEWVAGARGAGSSIDITIKISSKTSNYRDLEVSVIGLYFKNKYILLKETKNLLFKGVIKNTLNYDEPLELVYGESQKEKQEKNNTPEKPFDLELNHNEGMLHCKEKGVDVYVKIEIKKKELKEVPM